MPLSGHGTPRAGAPPPGNKPPPPHTTENIFLNVTATTLIYNFPYTLSIHYSLQIFVFCI